ncbi:hypothetical protein K1X12_01650 [Hyphomonas sp. WL0036]|uniref:tetratricopeptide repeat protein n=1 Tax=Hyphomonas sediminis TaxID=2866160 RepID=UPI001C816C06|nr:hypothetical protein [Hyphomonas sediminis]MBY9065582.1 hypothetical protein [Hyphomonas sediminis]
MKTRLMLLGAVLMSAALTLPAAAQGLGQRTQRTQAEIAFEQAETDFQKHKAARDEAQQKCASNEFQACYELAEAQRKGLGGSQDFSGAATNYKKVCAARDGRGCAGLAYLTVQGRGVTANAAEGRRLYKQACDYGEVSGCAAWGNMAYVGIGGAKDVHKGTNALNEACEKEYEWACTRVRELGAFNPEDRPMERMRDMRSN